VATDSADGLDGDREPAAEPGTARAADDAQEGTNGVRVHFTNGTTACYAFAVRMDDADWVYAERSVGDGAFREDEIEALNAATVCRIQSACVHLFADGAIHHGEDLLLDAEAILAESPWDATDRLA
jgi:hypothetical protein